MNTAFEYEPQCALPPLPQETIRNFRPAAARFISTELEVSESFAHLALSEENGDAKARYIRNARRAYDAIVRFLPRGDFRRSQIKEFQRRLAHLTPELQKLGGILSPTAYKQSARRPAHHRESEMRRDYDIFEVSQGRPMWRCHVMGPAQARARVEELAKGSANDFYAIHLATNEIVMRVKGARHRPA